MTRLFLYAAAAVVVALVIAGCGGDDGEDAAAPAVAPPAETTSLSKEELIAQGDAICAEVNAAVGTLASSETDGGASQAARLYNGMVERLRDLGAPSDDTAGYSEFIAAAEELAQAQSDVELAAERGEGEALETAEADASAALSSFQEAASDYGFEQCGEAPSAPAAGGGPDAGSTEAPAEGAEEEAAPEAEAEAPEAAPETGGAGAGEAGGAGGGAEAGGGSGAGGEGSGGGGSSGGIGPG